MHCGLYTRVSSRNQADKDYSSLETQKEKLEAYCKSQEDFVIYKVYEDGAYSGETLDRPALKAMLQDIRDGKINCVVAYKIDRLTRSVKDFHALMDLFDKHSTKFVSTTQSIDTNTATGRLMRNILLDFAQFEREMTADRTRDKMQQRAEKGMWNGGTPPYGYSFSEKRLVKNPNEAPKVEFMFNYFLTEPSLARLRQELHKKGWFTRSNHHWSKTSLNQILRNPVYYGVVRFNNQIYKGEHEAIIDEWLFKKVRALRPDCSHIESKIDRVYLLKGLLKCGDCGSTMTVHFTQKKHKDGTTYRIPYYRCTKAIKYGNSFCKVKHSNANEIERLVIESLHALSQNEKYINMTIDELNRDLKAKMSPLQHDAVEIKRRMDELEEEISKLVRLLGQAKISLERLELEIEKRESDKKSLENQYEELRRKINEAEIKEYDAKLVQTNLQNFKKTFAHLDPKEKTETLQCLVKAVTLHPDKITLEIFDLPEFTPSSQNLTEWLPD